MKLTLVRHGETVENANRIIQGQLHGSLNSEGKRQAEETAHILKDTDFDAIYTSDLKRCIDTAAYITACRPKTLLIRSKALRERYCADYQGTVYDHDHWKSLPGNYETRKYPGGESWSDVRVRIMPFLNDIFHEHHNGNILIVTHGGPLRAIRSLLEHRSLTAIDKEGTPNGGIWNCEMSQILTTDQIITSIENSGEGVAW